MKKEQNNGFTKILNQDFLTLEKAYQKKANQIAKAQWKDLLYEIQEFLEDQNCDLLYSFTDTEGVISSKQGQFTIDFSMPKTTFAHKILSLRVQLIMAMSHTEYGSALYNLLDSLYIMVLYAYYEDESAQILTHWKSRQERTLKERWNKNVVNAMIQQTLEKILI